MDKSKVAIFDLYNTLIGIETDEDNQLAYEVLSIWLFKNGISVSSNNLYEQYKHFCKEEIMCVKEDYPDINVYEVFKRIIELNGKGIIPTENMIMSMANIFRTYTTKSIYLFEDTIRILEELSGRVVMALGSNTQRIFTLPELKKFKILNYFEKVLFSSDIKISKPNPKFFKKILKDFEVLPQNAVFIGDDLFNDIGGAKQIGIHTIWINRSNKVLSSGASYPIIPDLEVTSRNFIAVVGHITSLLKL